MGMKKLDGGDLIHVDVRYLRIAKLNKDPITFVLFILIDILQIPDFILRLHVLCHFYPSYFSSDGQNGTQSSNTGQQI